MKKTIALTVLIISLSLVFFSFAKANRSNTNLTSTISVPTIVKDSTEVAEEAASSGMFFNMHLDQAGLSHEAFDYAIKGYNKLVEEGRVGKQKYLTIIDFSQNSRQKRFYILDMENGELAWNTFVAHGKNSGLDEAESFSNALNSEKSSLGFYITSQTYTGKHGLSLRISGLDEGFNSNAEARGVVVHGAPYVNAGRVNSGYMGRSQGCPALPQNEYAKVINLIKGGSVMFIYHPSEDYTQHSTILNS
jgi:hypothetical protein